jgi:hypothetical protein
MRATLGPEDVVLCIVCAMSVVKPGDLLTPAPWVVADIAEALADE